MPRAHKRTERLNMKKRQMTKRMDVVVNSRKEVPKRARQPPKKMILYEADPGSPKDDQDGAFVFLMFEDGYTTKIYNMDDILNKDDKPIAHHRDLKPGDAVLAKWSDGKFYNAKVEYIGTADQTENPNKGTKKDIGKKDAAAQRFYNVTSVPQAVEPTTVQQNTASSMGPNFIQPKYQPPSPGPQYMPQYQPPLTHSSPPAQPQCQPPLTHSSPPVQPQYQPPLTHSSPPAQPQYQPPLTCSPPPAQPQYQPPLTCSSPPAQPQYQPPLTHSSPPVQPQYQPPLTHSSPPVQPQYQPPLTHSSPPVQPQYPPPSFQSNLSPITPLTSSHLEHPQHYQPSNPLQQPPILLDLDQQQNQKIPSSTIAKESFLETLYCPSILKSASVAPTVESQPSTSENESSSSCSDSSADTYIIERDPIPEYGEPCVATESGNRAWKPCKACRVEVAKLKQEKVTLEQVLCSISGDQLQKARIFLDKVQQIQAQVGVATGSDKQELYPGSGLFLSSTRLAAILAEAKRDCLRLFHLLFDEFFKPEECQNAVAFGKHGKVPEGKAVLEKTKVDAILSKDQINLLIIVVLV
ncbi:uncharacterized protein V6R79_015451 [Siganus canaliculatus]